MIISNLYPVVVTNEHARYKPCVIMACDPANGGPITCWMVCHTNTQAAGKAVENGTET